MMGVFVQVNTESRHAKSQPVGYVIQENGCWDWTGTKHERGYGRLRVGQINAPAHRVVYERARGTIPAGLVLDHLCRNTSCVNPDHLEAVPERVNLLRGDGPPAQNARRERCRMGHELNGDNLSPAGLRRGKRICRTCLRNKDRTRWQARAILAREET